MASTTRHASGQAPYRLAIIYDGKCAFCYRVLRFLKRLDPAGAFTLFDAHDRETMQARFPIIDMAATNDAMFAVAPDGRVYRGFYAFRRMLRESPWLAILNPLFYFPGVPFVGELVYAWVARNRYRFGCRSDRCAVPERQ